MLASINVLTGTSAISFKCEVGRAGGGPRRRPIHPWYLLFVLSESP